MKSLRARLAADPAIGAGNVLATVIAHGADLGGPGLTFDTAVDDFPAEHPLTLGELDERVQVRTAWLHARGIGRRDVVAIWATEAADIVLSFLALTRIGAIPALLNGKMAPAIAEEYIRRLRVTGVLVDEAHSRLLQEAPILGAPRDLGTGDPALAPAAYRHHQDDPIVITHTSGTTGVPKAVLHTHKTLYAALKHLLTMPQSQGTDRILNALPIPHTATILMVNQVLGNRAEMLLLSTQDAPTVLRQIERWKPHGVYGFAVTWAGLAREDLSAHELDSVRMWFNTGDCAHEPHIRKLVAVGTRETVTRSGRTTVPGSHFVDGLGSSEMGHNGFHITHTIDSDHYGRCIGKPYQFASATVLDSAGEELPPGKVGLLGFRSPTVSPGYWNDSVNTYKFRLNGWFLTGDLVYRDDTGHYFHLDRVPDAVAGFEGPQLYTSLSEERILAALPEVQDCTVIIVQENGQFLTDVLLELPADAQPIKDRDERILQAVGPEVAGTLRRIRVVGEDEVPVTVTGKVRKVALRTDRLKAASPSAGEARERAAEQSAAAPVGAPVEGASLGATPLSVGEAGGAAPGAGAAGEAGSRAPVVAVAGEGGDGAAKQPAAAGAATPTGGLAGTSHSAGEAGGGAPVVAVAGEVGERAAEQPAAAGAGTPTGGLAGTSHSAGEAGGGALGVGVAGEAGGRAVEQPAVAGAGTPAGGLAGTSHSAGEAGGGVLESAVAGDAGGAGGGR